MSNLIESLARSPVAAKLLMVLVVLSGLTALGNIRHQIFPDLTTDLIEIEAKYPGAGPREVEKAVCLRIEESLKDLEAIETLSSVASDGTGTTTAKLRRGAWKHEALADIRERVDSIDAFPPHLERPSIHLVLPSQQVLGIAVSGPLPGVELRRLAERLRRELVALPEITKVDIIGTRRWEIAVEAPQARLRELDLTLNDLADAIRSSSIDLPVGRLRVGEENIQLRGSSQARTGSQLAALPIFHREDGARILLGDVAQIEDGLEERQKWTLLNGLPALMLSVSRVGDQDVLRIADQAKAFIAETNPGLPPGVQLTVWQDQSRFFRSQITLLGKNAVAGFLLVALTLTLFLQWRLALWVSCGIPLSFLGAFALMPVFGLSLNLISLFALILVLGIVVDDAIIVGENVFRLKEQGLGPVEASVQGVKEVSPAVFISVITTVIAFLPMLFIPGNAGPAMAAISSIVILALVFSLAESVLILPHHLSSVPLSRIGRGPVGRIQDLASRTMEHLIEHRYLPWLRTALRWRYLTWATALSLLLLSLVPVISGLLHFTFFPPVEAENLVASVALPSGTTAEATADALAALSGSATRLAGTLPTGSPPFEHLLVTVGHQPYAAQKVFASTGQSVDISAPHLGEVNIALPPAEQRSFKASALLERWREEPASTSERAQVRFDASLFSAGPTVHLELAGNDLERLQGAAELLERRLSAHPELFDVSSSLRTGQRELQIRVRPRAQMLGFSELYVAEQVRHGFQGIEVQRVQRGSEDVRIMVRYPARERASLEFLREMPIRGPGGERLPLSELAELEILPGLNSIQRVDGRRVAQITADAALHTDAAPILRLIEHTVLPELQAQFPDVEYSWAGGQEDKEQAMGGLEQGFLFAFLSIYLLLAVFCGSYSQPLVVVSTIPFGLIGAFMGHMLLGVDLNIYSLFGLVALSGVIVNDSLVLVDFVNRALARGSSFEEALLKAGEQRFRPIILTSLTTFFGLVPLIFERSLQAQFLIPMAISIAFGLLVASIMILFLVPAALAILHGRAQHRPLPPLPSSEIS